MKALILAGGSGIRLRPSYQHLPKCLVKIGNKPILEMIINPLVENKINDFVFLTGYLKEKVEDFVKEKYPTINPVFVPDPPSKPQGSSYIYSMWAARDVLKGDDFLYLHGDLFYDPVLAQKIIEFPHSGALVHKSFVSQKDFNAKVEKNLITKIGVKVFGKGVGFCLPFYKFLEDDLQIWMEEIDKFISNKKWDCYAEEALNKVTNRIKLYPVYFEKEFGLEIDDFEDLRKIKELFLKFT